MEIYQLDQFNAIAEYGTMKEAADRLYLSQPTLSYNLKKLESELGCKLFERKRNQLRLTPYGEIVLRHSKDVSEILHAMLAEVESEKRRQNFTLRIGCHSPIFSTFGMAQIAAALPELSFEVTHGVPEALAEDVKKGLVDLAIVPDYVRKPSLSWRPLFRDQAYLSVPRASVLAGLTRITREDLVGLVYNVEAGLPGCSDWYLYILEKAGVPASSIATLPVKEHLRVKDTLSTCNLITSFIMNHVRVSEERAVIPIEDKLAYRDIGILFREEAAQKIKPFLDYIAQNRGSLLSGNAFVPLLLFPEDSCNLFIRDGWGDL